MARASFDAIVLGLGGVGGAALYRLAKRGVRALGIERFELAHGRGSSHGQTRIVRQAYFEHPDYVPLARRAYELWAELAAEVGRELYCETGLLQVGPPKGEVVAGVLSSARRHRLDVESLSPAEVVARWPGFAVAGDDVGVFERRAGFLWVEECVRAHVAAARAHGAEAHFDETVQSWRAEGAGVCVETDRASYTAARLIVAAGPWAESLLGELGVQLEIRRKPLFWFDAQAPTYAADAGFPCFLFESPQGVFYGFPRLDARGVKAAEHSGGEAVADPLHVDRNEREQDRSRVERFLLRSLPHVSRQRTEHAVCLYTMSPDGHFLVGHHPRASQVVYAAGLSGHGFKFVGVLGEALVELALDGCSRLPIGFLDPGRLRQ